MATLQQRYVRTFPLRTCKNTYSMYIPQSTCTSTSPATTCQLTHASGLGLLFQHNITDATHRWFSPRRGHNRDTQWGRPGGGVHIKICFLPAMPTHHLHPILDVGRSISTIRSIFCHGNLSSALLHCLCSMVVSPAHRDAHRQHVMNKTETRRQTHTHKD